MSDFLSKFSNDQYNKDGSEEKKDIEEQIVKEEEFEIQEIEEQEEKGDKNLFKTSGVREETLVRDDERIKKRKKRIIIGSICFLLLILLSVFAYIQINRISVPNFALEKSLEDVRIWAAKNNIELLDTYEFSIEADEGNIISQSVKGGEKIQKGSTFSVVVSKGADPEEHLELPDFTKMKLTEIESWKDKNKAVNILIKQEFSEAVAKGEVLSVTFKTEGIDGTTYRRKDKLEIVVSKGKEVFEKNIDVPDFKNKARSEVEAWAEKNGVKVVFSEAPDKKIMEGNIVSQDIAPKTKIAKNDVLNVVVSRGKVSYAPSFYGLDETTAQRVALENEVSVTTLQYYSDTVAAGGLISQSLPQGTEISGQTIVLLYSLGCPYIGNFDGQDTAAIVEAINAMNTKGARLTYDIYEIDNEAPKGQIVTSNYKAVFVATGTHITVYVSRGK